MKKPTVEPTGTGEKAVELENKGGPMEERKEEVKGEGGEGAKAEKGWCTVHGEIIPVEEKNRYYCPECHRLVSLTPPAKKPPEPEEKRPKPPREELQEEAIKYLENELPNVYGMSKSQIGQCIEDLRQRPDLVYYPQSLYYHVKQYAGPKLNEYALGMRLARVCEILGISGAPQAQAPFIPPMGTPTQPFGPSIFGQPWQQGGWQPGQWGPQAPWQPRVPPTPPKTYKIVVDEQELETDEKGFLAWRKYLDDKEERERRRDELKKGEPMVEVPTLDGKGTVKVPASQAVAHMQTLVLQQQLSEARKPEEKVTIPVGGDETAEVPVSQAPYMLQTHWAQAERERAEREAEQIRNAYDKLSEQMTPEAIAKRAEAMGYIRTGSPAFGLISQAREDFEQKTDRLFGMLEKGRLGVPGAPTKGIPRYTPEQREKKAEEIGRRIERAGEFAEVEEGVIRAAKAVRDESRG